MAPAGHSGHTPAMRRCSLLLGFIFEEPAEGEIEVGAVVGREAAANDAFDVASVSNCHPSPLPVACGRQPDSDLSPVIGSRLSFQKPVVGQAPNDPMTGAVRDQEAPGQVAHPNRSVMGSHLVEYVVLVKRPVELGSQAGVPFRSWPRDGTGRIVPRWR